MVLMVLFLCGIELSIIWVKRAGLWLVYDTCQNNFILFSTKMYSTCIWVHCTVNDKRNLTPKDVAAELLPLGTNLHLLS